MSFSESFKKHEISVVDDKKITFNPEKSLEGHKKSVDTILHFDSPHNKLLSCSWDGTIRIWSSITCECLATIEISDVLDVLKMNGDFFISCMGDYSIRSFSISSHKELKMVVLENGNTPIRLLKLSEEHFLCHIEKEDGMYVWYVLSFARFEIVKKYEMEQLRYWDSPLLLSRNYPNCFYVATDAECSPIILIDFEKDKIVKEFTGHEIETRIATLSLFTNSRDEEILIACQTKEIFYSYNTTHQKFDTDKEINQEEETKAKLGLYSITCCCCLDNQYLFCGDKNGSVHLYEFDEEESTIRKIATKKFFPGDFKVTVSCFKLLSSEGKQSIRMITSPSGGDSGEIKITRVSGLRLKNRKNSYEESDLRERILFLFNEPDTIFFNEKKKNLVGIRMDSMMMSSISKLFLRV